MTTKGLFPQAVKPTEANFASAGLKPGPLTRVKILRAAPRILELVVQQHQFPGHPEKTRAACATIICRVLKNGGFDSNSGRSSTYQWPHAQFTRTRPAPPSFSIAETPQFPAVFQRAIDLSGGHVDADHCRGMAHLPAYRIIRAPGIARLRKPDTDLPVVADWRLGGRPVAPPARRNFNANSVDVAGVHPGSAHSLWTHTRLGTYCAGNAAGRGERVRCAGAAIVPDRDGRPRGFAECDCP